MAENEPLWPDLFELTKRLISHALPRLQEHLDAGRYVPRHHDWRKVEHFNSGFPHIVSDFDADVPDYDRLFAAKPTQFAPIGVGDWPAFKDLVSYVRANEKLRPAFSQLATYVEGRNVPERDTIIELFFITALTSFAFGTLDRAIHLHGLDFSDEQLAAIYRERERGLLREGLPVLVVVPIVITHFEITEPHVIGPRQFVAPISDDLQRARMPKSHTGVGVEHAVIGAATHAYVQTDWVVPNPDWTHGYPDFESWYPVATIEHFFSALRVVTGLDTGYAQALMKPLGWATSWTAHLPAITRSEIVRRFPPSFEKWGWLRERPTITAAQLAEVGEVFAALEQHGGALDLAATRLSAAMLRESERDSILDVVIGLEALLGDGEPTELTHKLSLRVAAVLAQLSSRPTDPAEAFAATKHMYRYRSAVAHGDTRKARKRETFGTSRGVSPTMDLASAYLRQIILALRDRPTLWSGEAIDRELVLPALRRRAMPGFSGPIGI